VGDNRGPIKRYTDCETHGRQPMTKTPDWTVIAACLECYIEDHERTLKAAIEERERGGSDWWWHDFGRNIEPADPSDEWAIGWHDTPPRPQP
jgi:hypothetical protein